MSDTRPGERRGPRWTIGQFSRMTRLTARMLRHYDRLGLLRPGEVDPRSGYRYYSRDELEPAVMLLRLREAGLGLDDIGRVLPALLAEDEMVWRPVLEQHLSRLGAEAEELGRRRERTLALLDHRGEQTMSIRSVRATIETIPAPSSSPAGRSSRPTTTRAPSSRTSSRRSARSSRRVPPA